MPAGRTNAPLAIAVAPEYATHPEIVKLRGQGHAVAVVDLAYDLILHPNASAWSEHLWPLLPVTLKAARGRKAAARRRT
jgi:hypothetical protein